MKIFNEKHLLSIVDNINTTVEQLDALFVLSILSVYVWRKIKGIIEERCLELTSNDNVYSFDDILLSDKIIKRIIRKMLTYIKCNKTPPDFGNHIYKWLLCIVRRNIHLPINNYETYMIDNMTDLCDFFTNTMEVVQLFMKEKHDIFDTLEKCTENPLLAASKEKLSKFIDDYFHYTLNEWHKDKYIDRYYEKVHREISRNENNNHNMDNDYSSYNNHDSNYTYYGSNYGSNYGNNYGGYHNVYHLEKNINEKLISIGYEIPVIYYSTYNNIIQCLVQHNFANSTQEIIQKLIDVFVTERDTCGFVSLNDETTLHDFYCVCALGNDITTSYDDCISHMLAYNTIGTTYSVELVHLPY